MSGKSPLATHAAAPKLTVGQVRPNIAPARAVTPLQQCGNQAVGRLLESRTIQAKMVISPPADRHEAEADRAADTVLRMPEGAPPVAQNLSRLSAPPVQRKCAACEEEQLQREAAGDPAFLHRKCAQCAEEELQRKAGGSGRGAVSPSLEGSIAAVRGGGHAMHPSSRSYFEPRFGADLSGVRLHTDSNSARLADSVGAHAFTTGHDIFFAAGRYQPDSLEGRRLLAHEVAHTIQQNGFHGAALQREASTTMQAPTAAPGCTRDQHEKIDPAARLAIQWLDKSIQQIAAFLKAPADRATKPVSDALQRHFHAADVATGRRVLERLQAIRHDVDALRPGAAIKVECHTNSDHECESANAYVSGTLFVFCPVFFGWSPEARAESIVHEMAHTLNAGIVDRAYRNERALTQLNTPEALANAESYGLLVEELGMGRAFENHPPADSFAKNCREMEPLLRTAIARGQRWNRAGETRVINNADTDMIRTHLGSDTKDIRQAAYDFYHRAESELTQAFEFVCDNDCGRHLASGEKAADHTLKGLGIGAGAGLLAGLALGALVPVIGAGIGALVGTLVGGLAGLIGGAIASHGPRIHVCAAWKNQADESARIESILAAAYQALGRSEADSLKYAKLAGAISAAFYPMPTIEQVDKRWIETKLARVQARLAVLRAQYQRSSDTFAASVAADRERESDTRATVRLRSQARSDVADRQLWGGNVAGDRIRSAVTPAVSGKTVTLTAHIQISYLSLSAAEGRRRADVDIPRISAAMRDVWQVTIENGEYAGLTLRLVPAITYLPPGSARDNNMFLIEVRGPDREPSSGNSPTGVISLALAHLEGNRVIVVAHELAHLFGFTDTYFTMTQRDRRSGKDQTTLIVGRSDRRNRPDLLGDIDPVGLERARQRGEVTAEDVARQTRPVHVWEEEATIVLSTLGVAPPARDRPTPDSEDFDPQTELDQIRGQREGQLARIRSQRQRIEESIQSVDLAEEIIGLEGEERDLQNQLNNPPPQGAHP